MSDSKRPTDQLEGIRADSEDDELATLQHQLDEERDRRLEERFVWICGTFVLLDAWWFSGMNSWGGPIALLALELPFLLVIGRQCQVEELSRIVNRLLDGWTGKS